MLHQKYDDAIYLLTSILNDKENWGEENIYVCGHLRDCYALSQQWNEAIKAYIRAFQYGTPKGEICNAIAHALVKQ